MKAINVCSVKEREERFKKLIEKEIEILRGKGNDYTAGKADEDAYANFRMIADLMKGCHITPYTIALIYKLKHTFSILTYAKTGYQESGESLESRHSDERNYTFILNELANDHSNWLETQTKTSKSQYGNEEKLIYLLNSRPKEKERNQKAKEIALYLSYFMENKIIISKILSLWSNSLQEPLLTTELLNIIDELM